MTFRPTRHVILFSSAAVLAFAPLGAKTDSFLSDIIGPDIAMAKSDNAGGNGNGGGNGGGNGNSGGNGNGGGNGNSNGGGSSKSASNGGGNGNSVGNSGNRGNGGKKGVFGNGTFKSVSFGKNRSGANKGKNKGLIDFISNKFGANKKTKRTNGRKSIFASQKIQGKKNHAKKVAAVNAKNVGIVKDIPIPAPKPKNFRAKLAGLNSLNRNYHAYLNSQDPRMAAIRDYAMNYIGYEDATAAAALAQSTFDAAMANFDAVMSAIVSYDGFSYTGITPTDLQSRKEALATIDATALSPEQAEALAQEIAALDAAIGDEATAQYAKAAADLAAAQMEAEQAGLLVTDEALTEALLAAANKNRVAEYGPDAYVDEEMLGWAKNLLGVEDAYGKIDEIREYQSTLEPETEDPDVGPEDSESEPEELAAMTLRTGL